MELISDGLGLTNYSVHRHIPEITIKQEEINDNHSFANNSYNTENYNIGNYECEYNEEMKLDEDLYTKYEYEEPEENFISVDDLSIRPYLIKNTNLDNITDNNSPKREQTVVKDEVILIDDEDSGTDANEKFNSTNFEQKQIYECFLCKKQVASNYNLRRHMMIHTGERPFGCDICFKRFREFSDLKKHRRIHYNEKNYKCMICHRNPPSATNPTKCTSCDEKEQENRATAQATSYDNILFDEVSLIDNNNQKKGFVCPLCDRIFGSRHNLKRHFMIHTGEKPYHCDICDKWFREVSTLKKHMVTHSRIKLFKCIVCGKEYNDYGAYNRHKIIHGNNNNYKHTKLDYFQDEDDDCLFECVDCRKQFINVTIYKKHLKLHSRELSFQCFICKKMFRSNEKLTSHFVTHNDDVDCKKLK